MNQLWNSGESLLCRFLFSRPGEGRAWPSACLPSSQVTWGRVKAFGLLTLASLFAHQDISCMNLKINSPIHIYLWSNSLQKKINEIIQYARNKIPIHLINSKCKTVALEELLDKWNDDSFRTEIVWSYCTDACDQVSLFFSPLWVLKIKISM